MATSLNTLNDESSTTAATVANGRATRRRIMALEYVEQGVHDTFFTKFEIANTKLKIAFELRSQK